MSSSTKFERIYIYIYLYIRLIHTRIVQVYQKARGTYSFISTSAPIANKRKIKFNRTIENFLENEIGLSYPPWFMNNLSK